MKGSWGAVLGVVCALGCAGAFADENVFNLRMYDEPTILDWNRATLSSEAHLLINLMEGLVDLDPSLKPVPGLAEKWEISRDGRTYTFKIRSGVKWSDGQVLVAQDFVYSWKRLISPATAARYAYFLFDIEGAELYFKGKLKDFSGVGIKALDDRTLQVRLNRPVAHWIYIPSFWVTFPLRQDMIEKNGNVWDRPGKMLSVGPYLLAEYTRDAQITFKPNPFYWRERGNLSQVNFILVKDDQTALRLFRSGKLDFMQQVPGMEIPALSKTPEFHEVPWLKTNYMAFVVDKYPYSNVNLRRAIVHAIDRSKIPQVLHGRQKSASTLTSIGAFGYDPKGGAAFDLTKARAELKKSGIDLSRTTLELSINALEKSLLVAQFIQSELKRNLDLNVKVVSSELSLFRTHLKSRAYGMYLNLWAADYPDADSFLSLFLPDSGNNHSNYASTEYQELVESGRYSTQLKEREKTYKEAHERLQIEDAVILPVFYEPLLYLLNTRFENISINSLNYLYLRKISLKKK